MGDLHSSAWMHVIDAKTSYNILLGRPWLHENKVVSSTYHQFLKYCEGGVEKKIIADDNPFTEAESYFADAKFYLKNYVSKEVKVDDVILTKSVAKKVDATTSKENITVEKEQVFHDRNKLNEASSSKKVTLVLRYVPKARKVEDPSSELQALPAKHTNEGFDPNTYKLLAKAGYDPNEPSKFGKLPPKASNPTQKMMMEKRLGPLKKENKRHGSDRRIGAPIFAKKEILTTRCPSLIPFRMSHISFNNGDPQKDEDAKDAPPELEEGVKTTVDALKEVNLGVVEDPKPTYISASLTGDEESKYIELLKEFKDVFAWSYKEMSGLDPKVVVHHLAVKRSARPVKQAQRCFRPELVPLIETKVNKLIKAGFVREVKYPTWISSIVPVRKKNGQIRVCVDFRDLNNACPKDEFPLPIHELMIDAITVYEAMSFMDGSSGYNQILMAPKDEELTTFRTPKGIYCYKSRKKDDHLQDLRMVFERLWRYQLRMNPLKRAFGVTSRKFLGFIVRHRGIEIDQAKVVKGQALADFLADHPIPDDWELSDELPDEYVMVIEIQPPWKMYFDSAAHCEGAGAGIVFITSQGKILPYSFTLTQRYSNNVAEYQALIRGLEMSIDIKQLQLQVFGDSKLVIKMWLTSSESIC
ncbi:uncharacterized protein LOC142177114 [Nicotiana tabacum]|uniref:Uncharacterized protein LOC142177114 n=1 Tax=Nicotiana tabacum TaxID=4097 RepID=A0AC58TWR4_TOBAC